MPCRSSVRVVAANARGPLAGRYMTQWQYDTPQRADGVAALQALATAQQQLSNAPGALDSEHGRNYSALNLLSYLGRHSGWRAALDATMACRKAMQLWRRCT